ncbi:MAG: hypothetical protein HZC38_00165 [Chloroflexi bacterium]|nr:hypothetical protein [Chloroflexota bacterium]
METQLKNFNNEFENVRPLEDAAPLCQVARDLTAQGQEIKIVFRKSQPRKLLVLRFPDPALDD